MNGNILNLTMPNPLKDWTYNQKFSPLVDNAFRALGVTATASQAEIRQAFEAGRKRLKLGTIKKKATDLEWLGKCRRDENSLLAAYSRASNPSLRLKERLFWFHQEIIVADLSLLDDLNREIKRILEMGGNYAKHSAALLSLAAAYSFDSYFNQPQVWHQTIRLWQETASDDQFWSAFGKLDLQGDFEPSIYPAEIEELRARTVQLILEEIAGTIRKILARDQINQAIRAVECVRQSPVSGSDIEYFENRTLGEYEEKYNEICEEEFEGEWLRPYSVRSRVLTFLKALLQLSGSQSALTKRILTVSAAHFLGFVRHYPTETEDQRVVYHDFVRLAWVLAPPDSYIFDEVAEYVQGQGLTLRIPKTDSPAAHFKMVLEELSLTFATFSGDPPVVLRSTHSDPANSYTEHAQGGDLAGRVTDIMWVVGFIILMVICSIARYDTKKSTSKYPTYTPPKFNVSFTPPKITLPEFSSIVTTFELNELIRRKGVIVVDARTRKEFDAGHIAGAVWFSANNLPKIVANQRKTRKKVVVYGDVYPDSMSSGVLEQLRTNGIKEVVLLMGGYQGWLSDRELPTPETPSLPLLVPKP